MGRGLTSGGTGRHGAVADELRLLLADVRDEAQSLVHELKKQPRWKQLYLAARLLSALSRDEKRHPPREQETIAGGGNGNAGAEPGPQPERHEPKLPDPLLRDLSRADWVAVFKRAAKETLDDNIPMIASALAYSSFLAIPSILLVTVGVFTLATGPGTINSLIEHFATVMPQQATQLISDSLHRLDQQTGTTVTITIIGFLLAVWSTTGAMTSFMTALNIAYDRKDSRKFIRKRVVALTMAAAIGFAFLLVAGLLILGPHLERWLGDALGIEGVLKYVWWTAQWPVLLLGLLAAFATLLWLGPDVEQPRWRFVTPGSVIAALVWLAVSGLFAVYTAKFGSYNKTWGSLSAVIVMLTWLWLTALALLFGAEVNAEIERSRELRKGEHAERDLQAPAKS
ncbi:MAG TPA: YihY/virulence factor BrkB family protein [Gaiellaceae bacterium]|nr:YihY/virulence factor BrkB family protein [Gaiellaceae bacterium]